MDFRIIALIYLFTCCVHLTEEKTLNRLKRNEHEPPPGKLSFQRSAVESYPDIPRPVDRSAPFVDYYGYGSRSLPLRTAVESIPDVTISTRRLPLRDAVERRPPPDEAFDLEFELPENLYAHKYTIKIPNIPKVEQEVSFSIPQKYSDLIELLNQKRSPYKPSEYFRSLIEDPASQRQSRTVYSYWYYQPYAQHTENVYVEPYTDVNKQPEQRIVCVVNGVAGHRKDPLKFSPDDVDPFTCTHVIYAFASIDPHSYKIISRDEEYDVIHGTYRALVGLKQKNPHLKVSLSVGGSGMEMSHRFSSLVSNAIYRREFIRSAVALIRKYEFDGLDIFWQYPGASELGGRISDKEFFAVFLEELSEIFKPYGWILSVSAPGSRFRAEDGFNVNKIASVVDFVNIQTYDFHKDRDAIADHHAPLNFRPHDNDLDMFNNVEYSVRYWLKQGIPASKVVVGIPFFGRSFTLNDENQYEIGALIKGPGHEGYYTQNRGLLGYFEICDQILNEGLERKTDGAGSPYIVNGDQWIGYDDPESIRQKVLFIKAMNVGGVYLSSVDLDDFKGLCGKKWPLMSVIRQDFKGNQVAPEPLHTPTKPQGTCTSDGLYSDPRSCANYFICRNSLTYHLSCGSQMLFDPTKGRCDYIEPNVCRPGHSVHFQNTFRDANNLLRYQAVRDEKTQKKLVCYLTNWGFYRKGDGKFVPEYLDQRLCTHIVYAFASLDPEKLLIKEFDPWVDLDNNLYERITSIKDSKVLLSLGGWTDSAGDKYSKLVSDGSARRKFVIGAVSFLRRHGFKGLHLDWNYPICWQSNCKKGPASDKPNFTKLLQELRREFEKENPALLLAVAISGYKEVIEAAYELPAIAKSVDFMSVMTYDYHGSWEKRTGHVSPLYQHPGDTYPQYNTNFTMEYLVANGAPREKLLVGIPFYGQTFTLSKSDGRNDQGVATAGPGEPGEYTKQPGMLSYYEICSRVKNSFWTVKRDANRATGPYAYHGNQWVSYDDVDSVQEKAKYITSHGFGGAVAWTVDLDDFLNKCCQQTFPLLRSLNKGLGLFSDNAMSQGDCTKPPTPVTPPPPTLTTGFDTGAESSTTEHWGHHPTTKPSTVSTPWWEASTPSTTESWQSTKRTTTTRTTSSTTKPWWVPSTPKPTTTSTYKPTTTSTTIKPTTSSWWTPEVSTTVPTPAVTMPEIEHEEIPTKCESGLYLPDPSSCASYYRCVLGELKKERCAGGLHWNKKTGNCDWPDAAECAEQKPFGKPTTLRPTTTTWPSYTTSKRPTTTHRPIVTPSPENCNTGDYFPHEQCSGFYVCVNGHLVSQKCAPGLYWNTDSAICDWSYRVKCAADTKYKPQHTEKLIKEPEPGNKPNDPCRSGSFSAVTGDCTQYLICLWNKYESFQCAEGLHWNNERKVCDWPENAKCAEGTPETEGDEHDDDNVETVTKPSTTLSPPTPETPTQPFEPMSDYYKIVCYFTNWAWYRKGAGKYVPEDIDANLCTHIVYGFAVLDYENLVVRAHDSWADFDNNFYSRVVAYKKKGKKVVLALGGWNDSLGDKYSRLVNNPSARKRFIKHVLEFLAKYDFDGLDLDWEYPKCWQVDCKKGPDSDKPAFAAFVKELKEAFAPKGYLLSAAVSPNKLVIDSGYDVPVVAKYLDWIAVMTYDYHGQWDKQTGHVAPFYVHPDAEVAYFNTNFTINYWISAGAPRRKLVLGMPLYGQSFQLENVANHGLNAKAPGPGEAGEFTGAAGFLAYYEICDRIKNKGWTVVKDPYGAMGPYAYKGNQWVSFDDAETIRRKSEYIKDMNLGGGMIWALDLDDFKNRCGDGKHPLLSVIRRVLASPGESPPEYATETHVYPTVPTRPVQTPPPTVEQTSVSVPVPQTTSSNVDKDSEYKVVCYFTNWAWYRQGAGKYLPSDIDPDLCTHIIYGFAVLDGDQLIIKPHDTWADYDNKFYEKLTAFKAKGIKVLIAIGGWNDSAGDKYSKLVNNPSSRRRFIAHVVDFIENNNFDGLDLDWEYPKCWQVDCTKGPESDKQAFSDFVMELHNALRPKGLMLSAAVSPNRKVVDAGYDVPALSRYLDWIAVMCYDYHGQWDKVTGIAAPMYAHPEDEDVTFNTNFTINYWISQGADRKKIVMGMPLYGQSFSLADNSDNGLNAATYGGGEAGEETRARGFLSYYEICSNIIQKSWNVVRDKKFRIGPYAYLRDQWVSFDDVAMIRYKSEYIKNMGLGGGMVWALDLDDFKNICGCENYPLLRTINRVLRNYKVPDPKCQLGIDSSPSKPFTPKPTESSKPWEYETPKPSTSKPWQSTTTNPWQTERPTKKPSTELPCDGRIFVADSNNCNQYYFCNQGQLMLQSCPSGLFWNENHCDWPENTECHPDGTTTEQDHSLPIIQTTPKPSQPGTGVTTGSDTSITGAPGIPSDNGYKVVCYFTNWAWYRQDAGKYLPEDVDPNLCTHIAYGFAVLDPNTLTIKPHDSWADMDNNFYTRVTSYKAKGIKVLIAIGGWNDSLGNKYSRLVNDPSARARFIEDVIQFIEKWDFDGLDLDWEYPKCWQVDCNKGPQSDKQGFASLVVELSLAFKPRGWLLSAAVSPSKTVIDAGYDVPVLSEYLDWIAVMTYDYHGHWDKQTGHVAPLYYYPGDAYDYFNANYSMHYWMELGASPSKLVMGMPFYGQSFSLADASKNGLNEKSYGPGEAGDYTRAGGFLAFYEVCERVKRRSWTVHRDSLGRIGPYAINGNQWVSYDDIAEIRRKSRFIKDLQLAGGMLWALDLDDFRNTCGCGKYPLLKTMNNELRGLPVENNLENCT